MSGGGDDAFAAAGATAGAGAGAAAAAVVGGRVGVRVWHEQWCRLVALTEALSDDLMAEVLGAWLLLPEQLNVARVCCRWNQVLRGVSRRAPSFRARDTAHKVRERRARPRGQRLTRCTGWVRRRRREAHEVEFSRYTEHTK